MTTSGTQKAILKPAIDIRNNRVVTIAVLFFLGIGTGLVSMMLGASYFGLPMFFSYFSSPLLLLLNILPPVLFMFLFYYVSGRGWIGFATSALVVLLLSLINYFKIQVRSTPFIASDIYLADEARKVMAGYALIINWKVWLSGAFFIVGTLFSMIFLRHKPRAKTRVIGVVTIIVASVLVYSTVYTSAAVYNSAKGSYETKYWSKAENSIVRSFLYPYIYSFQDLISKPQIAYNEAEVKEALNEYRYDNIAEDQKINFVSVMLEAYADLSKFNAIDFNVDVYGPLHKIQEESVYGSLIVNTFGGGTINTERSFLTGYTELEDFSKPTNSYLTYLNDQGYYTEGIHVGDGWYYDRNIVNPNLGFKHYYFLEDFADSNRTDDYFFSKVISLFETRNTDIPYFSYSLSYQNHGSYDSSATGTTAYIKQGNLSNESYNILNNYLAGIDDTTHRIYEFIDYFRETDEPVVVVLFGDHMPWLGNDNFVFNELGVSIDMGTEEGFKNFYSTPYIIWANDAAKRIIGNDFVGYGGDLSPCFLMNEIFDQCVWGGNAYMDAANDLRAYTSIVNTATGYFYENGVLTTTLSDEAEAVYKNFKKIEYSWQHNLVK